MPSQRDSTALNEAPADDAGLKPRHRFAKGQRPVFLSSSDADRLLAMLTALVGEVSVLRERLDTTERLAEQGLPATPANIETYHPDPDVEAAREAYRVAMLDRVFRILAQPRDDAAVNYEAIVDQFS